MPGRYGWEDGFDTSLNIDPYRDLVTIFLSQRLMQGLEEAALDEVFQALAYRGGRRLRIVS
ncbi:hypothetical protein FG93_02609 [Bosea sp. LC85]|uniref:hypothetical protein n=1 Tax=Bosea sp. LC85 TaxID=1502851 RepID=UPI0004E46912|nr:hypothetical protein [Bosea sp. LC85]KFC70852.1 hypothetical protein FG93_02609 [Bosea sp. LC85]